MKRLYRIVIALGLSAAISACGGKKNDIPPPAAACLADPIVMEADGSVAAPPVCMKSCTADIDCTAVNTSCPGCCEFVALSKSYEDHYDRFKREECRKYHGLVCECSEKPAKVHCVEHVCTLE